MSQVPHDQLSSTETLHRVFVNLSVIVSRHPPRRPTLDAYMNIQSETDLELICVV